MSSRVRRILCRLFQAWTLLVAILASFEPLRAELIIDDFNDAAEVVTPAMINDFVVTPGVGDLNARRSIRIFGSRAEPTGRIDVNAGGSSAFVAELGSLNPTGAGLKIVSVQSQYDFTLPGRPLSYVDVTEGGANNAFFLDFRSLQFAVMPRYLTIVAMDDIASFTTYITELPNQIAPFTIVAPFDAFGPRGGSGGQANFSRLRVATISLRALEGASLNDLEFSMELDRVRVDRVPEPANSVLAILGLTLVSCMRSARQRLVLRRRRGYEICQNARFGGRFLICGRQWEGCFSRYCVCDERWWANPAAIS